MSRGPYKRYEYDPGISVPKTTTYYRRKRQIEEVEQDLLTTEIGNVGPYEDDVNEVFNIAFSDTQSDQGQQNDEQPEPLGDQGFIEENVSQHENQMGDGEYNRDEIDNHASTEPTSERTDSTIQNENSDMEQQENNNADEPIYPNAAVTKAQSLLLVLAYMLRHKLTDVALKDLLMMLNTFSPSASPTTKYKFYKSLKMENSEIHYYCSVCSCYMGKDQSARLCETCQTPFCCSESMEKGSYFLYIPVKQQIKAILSDPKLYQLLTNRDLESLQSTDTVNDITTSRLYKQLISKTCFTGNDVSLTWNTDGIQKFIDIDARQALAVQNLLGTDVINRSGTIYERFIYCHKLYCSRSYTRAKRHSNYCVSFEHHNYKYGAVLRLLQIKPSCECNSVMLQYCKCDEYKVVIFKPMVVSNRELFTDADFKVTSYFIAEVGDVDDIIAIFPEQIRRKCISISAGGQMYVCPLPYRIYGD